MSDAALPDAVRKLVEGAIVKAPFPSLVGIESVSIEQDRVRLRLPFRNEVVTVGDTVHGGAIAALVDAAATAACWSSQSLPPGARGTTIGFSLSFLAAGRGRDLYAEARVTQRGSSISSCDVEVEDADGRLVARALISYKLSGRPSPDATLQRLFEGKSPQEQQAVLARLERAGAALYRAWAEHSEDPVRRAALLEAARREEQNADTLETD